MNAGTEITPARTNFWLLKLVPALPFGRWLCGAAVFVLILLPYLLLSASSDPAAVADVDPDVALFFAILIAYMIPVHHLIMQRSLNALRQLRPCLSAEPELADQIALRITQLQGEPDFDPAGLTTRSHAEYDDSLDLLDMVREDLVAERVAIESYSEIIAWLGTADPTTRRMLEDILAVEEEHADDLLSILEEIGGS